MHKAPDFSGNGERGNVLSLHIDMKTAVIILIAVASFAVATSWQLWDVRQSVKDGTGDRWRKSHMREFANQMRYGNKGLSVPDVDEIAQKMDR